MLDRVLGWAALVPFALGTAAAPADPPGEVVLRFEDPEILESSGLAVVDGMFATTNDSGDEARIFVVDPATGATAAEVRWSAESPVDVEALAPAGDGEVWVGDIGDNPAERSTIAVARVPVGRTDATVAATTYELGYPDGAHDAETLLAHPRTGRLYVASKVVFGGRLYAAPRRLDPDRVNELRALGPVTGLATDGAFWPDGRHLVVRDYARAVVLTFPGLEVVGSFPLPREQQGEGIAVAPDGTVYTSTEGQFAPVHRVPLPRAVERAMAPQPDPSPEATGQDAGGEVPDEAVDRRRDSWPWVLAGVAALLGLGLAGWWVRPRR